MRVILLEDIRGLGKRDEVKEVSDGYVRNFLLPRKLVKPATPRALEEHKVTLAARTREEDAFRKKLEELGRLIESRYLEFHLKTDAHGSVFGSVTNVMIVKAMREHGWLGTERVDIKLDHPIKKIGDQIVVVDLKKGIRAKLKVVVRAQL